jgi:hypothetical protein
MKVKRREYDRLKAIAETRFRVFVVTGPSDNLPIEQAIIDTTIQDLVLISKFRDPERAEYIHGPIRIDVGEKASGYEHFVFNKYDGKVPSMLPGSGDDSSRPSTES